MNFTEKLKRCARDINKSKAGAAAGLKSTTISNYIAKKSVPRADIALKIALALKVPFDWLVDDSREWPPPPPESHLANASTEELTQELGRRMAPIGIALLTKFEQASKADWASIIELLLAADPSKTLPKKLQSAIELPGQMNLLANELRHFDPHVVLDAPPRETMVLPGYDLGLLDLFIQRNNVYRNPAIKAVAELSTIWLIPEHWKGADFPERVEQMRANARAELEKMRAPRNGGRRTGARA